MSGSEYWQMVVLFVLLHVLCYHVGFHGTRYEVQHKQKLLAGEFATGGEKNRKWLHASARNLIEYGGETWSTPSKWKITPIAHGMVSLPSGQVSNYSGVYGFRKWYWQTATKSTRHPQIITVPVLSLIQVWNGCFQHIVFDTLPKLTFVCPFLMGAPNVHVAVMNALQRDLVLEACPCDPTRFIIAQTTFRSPIVYVPYFVGEFPMGIVPPNFMQPLNQQTTPGVDVVYLARKRGTPRSVHNKADVLATLAKKWPNLRVIYPSNNWRSDRDSVRNAGVIIGPHGGAMANMIFAPASATVIEFIPLLQRKRNKKNERPCYFGLAHGLGFTYHAIEPSHFEFDQGSMVVPTGALATQLEAVMTK